MELMSELRSALNAPSDASWSKIRWLLERWMGELGVERMRDVALPYCAQHLTRWPDDLARPAPPDWITRLKRGEEVPALALATELHVVATPTRAHDEQLIRLRRVLDAPGTPLRALRVDGYTFWDEPDAQLVARLKREPDLEWLEVSEANLGGDGLIRLLGEAELGSLRRLDLQGNQIGTTGTRWLAAQPTLRGLARLDVRRNHLTQRALRQLAPHGELVGLERLEYEEGNVYASGWRREVRRSTEVTEALRVWMKR